MANNCKVFTPNEYVIELLDAVGYENKLYGESVLENSCGDGFILMEIVRRYIDSCIQDHMAINDIKKGLEQDICGIELEYVHIKNCIKNLDSVASEFGIEGVNWTIFQDNYLLRDLNRSFSFIVGNPPYVVYRDIDAIERNEIKAKFSVCEEGKFDYYYAFLEKGTNELANNGKLAYIIPSSIYKNVFAENLRKLIKPVISKVYDYTFEKKFPGVTTSSTILVLDKGEQPDSLTYIDVVKNEMKIISKEVLQGKWNFLQCTVEDKKNIYRFGDYYKVSNTIATLFNKAFVLENITGEDDDYYYNNAYGLEKGVVRDVFSRKRKKKTEKIKIIFPYYFENDEVMRYDEKDFLSQFPNAARHLEQFITNLKMRKADKSVKWYEYGRCQAISYMHKRKLVIPSILSTNVEAIEVDENTIPLAGVYIIEKGAHTLDEAKAILEGSDFLHYLNGMGIFTTGKSRRVSVHDIENFTFSKW